MSRTIHERNLGNDMDNHIFEIRGKFYKGHCFPGLNDYIHEIRDNAKLGNMHWEAIRIEKVEEIIRSHMDEQEVFKFDFNRVKSFDCQCGRHYVNTYNDSWIPVSKKLPERDYETVLCVDADDYYFVAVYTKEDGFRTEDFGADYENIIAWQPLPELYREE